MDSIKFRHLLVNYDSFPNQWQNNLGYFGESNKMIYFLKDKFSDPELIYDFNLSAGDSIKVNLHNRYIEGIVSRIDSIQLYNLEWRKRFFISFDSCYDELIWVEGIGDITNPFSFSNPCENGLTFDLDSVSCFKIINEIQYMNDFGSCYLTSSLATPVENKYFNLFPNPSINGLINFQTKRELKNVFLHNSVGRCSVIKFQYVNTNIYKINLEDFTNGIYFLNIQFENGELHTEKLILN